MDNRTLSLQRQMASWVNSNQVTKRYLGKHFIWVLGQKDQVYFHSVSVKRQLTTFILAHQGRRKGMPVFQEIVYIDSKLILVSFPFANFFFKYERLCNSLKHNIKVNKFIVKE